MLKELPDTSIFVLLLKHLYRWDCHTEQIIGDIYRNSQTHKLISRFWERIKVSFRFSFLGRITNIKGEGNAAVLDNSKTVQYLSDFYKRWRDKVIYCINASKAVSLAKRSEEEFYILPVKTIGIIVVVTVVTNVALSIILGREITLWGWLMRGLFLFVGAPGLFCKADWPIVKGNSIILRKIGAN